MIDQPLALLAFMFLVVAFARLLEERFVSVQKVSSAVVCTLLGMALANAGVIPHTSSIHEGVYLLAVPYAIVLVILASRLGDLRRAGKWLVVCFLIAAGGSFLGGFVASQVFHPWLGPETWKLGGAFTGAFIGGGMNFAAVGRGLEISPDLFAAAFVVDNLSTVPWLLGQVAFYTLLTSVDQRRRRPASSLPDTPDYPAEQEVSVDPRRYWTSTSVNVTDMAILAAIPLGALWIARSLTPWIPGFPEVLWLTTLALIIAQLPPVQRLKGAAVFSYFALHLFFIVVGANSDIGAVLEAGPILFLYMLSILAIHGLVVYGGGWLLKVDLKLVTLASQAAVGGPGSAMAISMAMKWEHLVTPGIIIGIFGYAIGNYFGFACAYLLRGLL